MPILLCAENFEASCTYVEMQRSATRRSSPETYKPNEIGCSQVYRNA